MSRSVELGRAVLHAPAAHHELWLTTLITVSPKQDSPYLARLTSVQFREALASGLLWIDCGHDMHMNLELTVNNEALPHKQLQTLTNAILQAPVWQQLMLRPSLPNKFITNSGTIRLNISHVAIARKEVGQKHHRLFLDVPATDIGPPEGVLSVSLQSVRLCLDILETGPRRKLVVPRSNSFSDERIKAEHTTLMLFDIDSTGNASSHDVPKPVRFDTSRKRKRSVTSMPLTPLESPYQHTDRGERDMLVDLRSQSPHSLSSMMKFQADVRAMVDSALRLSIRGTISRYPNELKAKANTFRMGLADVAPALWRSGYMDALSQRAQLMPTIAQSLAQTGFAKTMSISLKSKMEIINNAAFAGGRDKTHGPGYTIESNTARITQHVATNLWVHSQKSLLRDSTPPTLACIGSPSDEVCSDSDDMLVGKDTECNEGACAVHDEDMALNNSSESTDDGCLLPSTPETVTTNNHHVQIQHEAFTKPFPDHGIAELEEELLFDPLSY
ncbi:hypothetical protein COCC4DRAFT_150283 [Bipolaris maydis ATCC 48331]|nr:uncharacterized protein COCC4DRAFT_150283 [Bipolaris maydis ATCC 48331]KAJ5031600.1 hypothetical protein J3E73DRAFT_180131 [Bipolaris maydis]ENI00666.1 hypothetical protein COCC4DRAFT_150283 [Bipolaris maydis ATCC 48331]KAJ5035286.1 hypothetical protein J3E74DRAFT_231987 [Bipolaris maydis]KAJ5060354.1 hypothetical protein J3E74DRAFT_215456 [Bipolaris maydis]KAJ6201813.1 hypothetical protein J3E72DRAFT_370774 [Bipolaris maydis]